MNAGSLKPRQLATRLASGDGQPLSAVELDCVLNWLSGSNRAGADRLTELIGTPRQHPELTRSVLLHLDAQLFDQGQLSLSQAHLTADLDECERRVRFRRLMTAFHPDHHPDDSGWLTPRSQAIHVAWRRFRRGEQPAPATALQTTPGQTVARPESWGRRSARLIPMAPALVQRLRSIRNFQAKALLTLAALALLPVIWVYFAYQPYRQLAPTPIAGVDQTDTVPSLPDQVTAQADVGFDAEPIQPEPPVTVERVEIIELTPQLAARPEVERPAPDSAFPETAAANEPLPAPTTAPAEPALEPELDVEVPLVAQARPARPESVDIAPPQEREAAAEAVSEPASPAPAQDIPASEPDKDDHSRQRIAGLLESYRETFERGQLDGLLGHFTDSPSENGNYGRAWLRQNYQQLFDSSIRRRLNIEIHQIAPGEENWQVEGRFHLQIDYAERRSVRASRNVRYLILEDNEQFRIASIRY